MFLSNAIKFFIIIGFLSINVYCEFPEDPKPCKYGDTACITKQINYFLTQKSKGDDSISLPEMDPLFVKKLILKQDKESPVNIKMVLTDTLLSGSKTAKVKTVKGFGKDLSQKHKLVINFEYLELMGNYEIDGKLLILPIKGKGKSNMTMINPDLVMEFNGVPYQKDGGTYMKIDKMNFYADPKRVLFKLDNLFNGDKALGETMNIFMNENWSEIYNEVRDSLDNAFKQTVINIIDSVFSKYPYDKYFVE